MIKHSNIKCNH